MTTIFLPFGACFMSSIIRFSVGPFTAQLLKIIKSASEVRVVIVYPACFRHPARVSPSAVLELQP